jgi:hypothetical protein
MNNANIDSKINDTDYADVEVLDEDQVKVIGGFNPSFRFSEGKIVTGSEDNGTLEEKKLLTLGRDLSPKGPLRLKAARG